MNSRVFETISGANLCSAAQLSTLLL